MVSGGAERRPEDVATRRPRHGRYRGAEAMERRVKCAASFLSRRRLGRIHGQLRGKRYVDAERTVTGIFIKPAGNGPFPSLVINHGTGGSASSFSLARANEMSPWGLACIGANLTHAGGQPQDLETWGYSPENLARIRACIAVLATRSDVDVDRLAMWGHSRGAFATIGATSAIGSRIKAMGASAGGIVEDPGTFEPTLPNVCESSGITAPTIFFHGSTDTTVMPETSQRLKGLLDSKSVTCLRIVYDTSAVTPAAGSRNLHQVPSIYSDILTEWRAWLEACGPVNPTPCPIPTENDRSGHYRSGVGPSLGIGDRYPASACHASACNGSGGGSVGGHGSICWEEEIGPRTGLSEDLRRIRRKDQLRADTEGRRPREGVVIRAC